MNEAEEKKRKRLKFWSGFLGAAALGAAAHKHFRKGYDSAKLKAYKVMGPNIEGHSGLREVLRRNKGAVEALKQTVPAGHPFDKPYVSGKGAILQKMLKSTKDAHGRRSGHVYQMLFDRRPSHKAVIREAKRLRRLSGPPYRLSTGTTKTIGFKPVDTRGMSAKEKAFLKILEELSETLK